MPKPRQESTAEDYLAFEETAETKHEYVGGEVVAMAGASARHNLITSNLVRHLSQLLEDGPCRVFTSDQRVRVEQTGAYVYPDVTVVCESPRLTGERPSSLENPVLVVEVLSRSTAEHDRGAKLAHYRRLASVEEILLIEPNEHRIERYRRLAPGDWRLADIVDGAVELASLKVRLEIDDIYAKTVGLPLDPA